MLSESSQLHKFLISTSAKFVGHYKSEDISIDLSFPIDRTMDFICDSAYSRTFLVVTISVPPETSPGVVFGRNQSHYGDIFCLMLSLLYGKEFKYHGLLETYGVHRLPSTNYDPNPLFNLPIYNSSPRIDLEIKLNLEFFSLIEPLILEDTPHISEEFRKKFLAAGKFYNRALRIFPAEPELAYLDLITCGEIISSFYDEQYSEEELYDEQLISYFQKIETLEKGTSIANNIKSRLYQVKRKFTTALLKNLNDEFFKRNEASLAAGKITRENIETAIKSSYDLRSLYVHTGLEFGRFVLPSQGVNEIVLFSPSGLSTQHSKAIGNSLSFIGLERIIRYSLLSLLNSTGLIIDAKLNN